MAVIQFFFLTMTRMKIRLFIQNLEAVIFLIYVHNKNKSWKYAIKLFQRHTKDQPSFQLAFHYFRAKVKSSESVTHMTSSHISRVFLSRLFTEDGQGVSNKCHKNNCFTRQLGNLKSKQCGVVMDHQVIASLEHVWMSTCT